MQTTNKPPRKNRAIFIAQDCSAAGKTGLSKNVGDWFVQGNHTVTMLDAEIATKGAGMFRTFFPVAKWIDIHSANQFDDVLEAAELYGDVVCDVGANSGKIFLAWLRQVGVVQLEDYDTSLTLITPITAPEPTSVTLFQWGREIDPALLDWVVAKVEKDGTEFRTYDLSKDGDEFRANHHPTEIRIAAREPLFEDALVSQRLTMLQAIAISQSGENLELLGFPDSPLRRRGTISRIQRYHSEIMATLDSIRHLLLRRELHPA